MSFLQKIIGSLTGNVVEVDSNNNMQVNLPTTPAQSGYASLATTVDEGSVIGSREVRKLQASHENRLTVGEDLIMFHEQFMATVAESRNIWANVFSTMTKGVTNGIMRMNTGLSVANGAYTYLTSCRSFSAHGNYALTFRSFGSFDQLPQTNNICEWGFQSFDRSSSPSSTVDGAFFRLNSSGVFQAVVSSNGSDQPVTISSFSTVVGTATMRTFEISLTASQAKFFIDGVLYATIDMGTAASSISLSGGYFVSYRIYNTGTVPTAQVMTFSSVTVLMKDAPPTKPWNHIMAGLGRGAYQIPNTSSNNAISSNYTNSLAVAAGAAMTNTTAALGTGLGGQFSALPTLAAGTDGILCSYLNIASSAQIAGRNLYITGVRIQGVVTTVLGGNATPVIYSFALAGGSNALSAATADSGSSVKGPRKITIGLQTYAASAAVATLGQELVMKMDTPMIIAPGEYVQIHAKNIGVVTTSGVITFLVAFDGYFE